MLTSPLKGFIKGTGADRRLLVLSEMLLLGWESLSPCSLIRKASRRFVLVGLTREQPQYDERLGTLELFRQCH